MEESKKKSSKINIGNSGEYFVAAELERRGFTAAVPMSNSPAFDILAISRDDSHKQIALQVKTARGNIRSWPLTAKNDTLAGENIFYVFVVLNELCAPDYYIVPSKIVAEQISKEHRDWLDAPGKKGQPHNENPIRKFHLSDDSKYKGNWDSLK